MEESTTRVSVGDNYTAMNDRVEDKPNTLSHTTKALVFRVFLLYSFSLLVGSCCTALMSPLIGGFVMVLSPTLCILLFFRTLYGKHILPWQDLCIFAECYAFNWLVVYLKEYTSVALSSENCATINFALSFGVAASFQEVFKYTLARRFLYKSHMVDPRALVYYTLFAAQTFAFIENTNLVNMVIESESRPSNYLVLPNIGALGPRGLAAWLTDIPYDWHGQLGAVVQMTLTGIMQAMIAVPMHACLAIGISSRLAKERFLGKPSSLLTSLLLPIGIHGMYSWTSLGGFTQLQCPCTLGIPQALARGLFFATIIATSIAAFFYAKNPLGEIEAKVAPMGLREALAFQQGCAESEVRVPFPDSLIYSVASFGGDDEKPILPVDVPVHVQAQGGGLGSYQAPTVV